MRIAIVGLVATLSVALSSCSAGSKSARVDGAAEAQKIATLESEWSDMFGAKNLDGISALLAKDSVLIMPGAAPIVGIENIRRATRTMMESDDEVAWKSDYAKVAPSGDMAYDYGTATTILADGSVVEGYYLVVWIREDDTWKIAADMFN